MARGKDRLSELPDDLLRRVLHFAPAREAAATDALSRHWHRSLWWSSGAVNLEAHLPEHNLYGTYGYGPNRDCEAHHDRFCARRDAFVFAAGRALELADDPVTRLTFHVVGRNVSHFLSLAMNRNQYERLNMVADLLKHPAAHRVEELRIDAVYSLDAPMSFEVSPYEVSSYSGGARRSDGGASIVMTRARGSNGEIGCFGQMSGIPFKGVYRSRTLYNNI